MHHETRANACTKSLNEERGGVIDREGQYSLMSCAVKRMLEKSESVERGEEGARSPDNILVRCCSMLGCAQG